MSITFIKALLTIVILLSFVSCSSTKMKLKDAHRIHSQSYSQMSKDRNHLVYIIRDGGFVGSGIDVSVQVDKKDIAELNAGQMSKVYLSRGMHSFFITTKKPFVDSETIQKDFIIKEKESTIRIEFPGDSTVKVSHLKDQ